MSGIEQVFQHAAAGDHVFLADRDGSLNLILPSATC